jgi:hypothetical protein
MLAAIGHAAPGAKHSDFFQVMGICNYPVEDFPYRSRVATSRGRYDRGRRTHAGGNNSPSSYKELT